MADTRVFIYLDQYNNMFVDEKKTTPFSGSLYRSAEDLSISYIDADLTMKVELIQPGHSTENCDDSQATSSHAKGPICVNDSFNKEQTLFLIEHMREHVTDNGDLPRNLQPKTLSPQGTSTTRKLRRSSEVLKFLRQSEENSQLRHQDTMEQLKSAQEDFKTLMTQMLQKM